jgi:serine/threonine-protein kinase
VAAGLPGGDPLAAALAAGETPSPEMVAAAGEQDAIEKWRGLVSLAGVAVGLVLVCWLAQRTYLVNQVGLNRHPESLADAARQMIQKFGYTYKPAMQAHDFRRQGKDAICFWYRQRPTPGINDVYFTDWGEESFTRIGPWSPGWWTPGELAVELDPAGKLIRFRAIPEFKPDAPKIPAKPDWQQWFPKEFTGLDLAALELIEDRGPPPPDAFDQLQVWHGCKAGSGTDFYLQAAAYAGMPVYFEVLSPAAFEGRTPSTPMWRIQFLQQDTSSSRQFGERFFLFLFFVVFIVAVLLAWRNFRLGRGDRKGAFRVAFFIFCTGMLAWLFLASHIAGGYEIAILQIGVAQVLWKAAFFWLCYLALEPYVRRLWPQLLISWSRLVNGQWRDPLVGQNLLLGVLAGVFASAIFQLEVLAPAWFGLTPRSFMASHALTLDGPLAASGYLLVLIIKRLIDALFLLAILFLCRLVLRRALLASCAFVVLYTVADIFFYESHPVFGWFSEGIFFSLLVWVYLRLGFLAGIVMMLTEWAVDTAPLTTNFSAWYAGNGLAVVAFLFAVAAFGFYTSQAGRPIFENVSRENWKSSAQF